MHIYLFLSIYNLIDKNYKKDFTLVIIYVTDVAKVIDVTMLCPINLSQVFMLFYKETLNSTDRSLDHILHLSNPL